LLRSQQLRSQQLRRLLRRLQRSVNFHFSNNFLNLIETGASVCWPQFFFAH